MAKNQEILRDIKKEIKDSSKSLKDAQQRRDDLLESYILAQQHGTDPESEGMKTLARQMSDIDRTIRELSKKKKELKETHVPMIGAEIFSGIKDSFKKITSPITNTLESVVDFMKHPISSFFETEFGQKMKDLFKDLSDTVTGHFQDVLGEIHTEVIAPLTKMGISLIAGAKSLFGFGQEEDPAAEEQKKTNKILGWFKNFFIKKDKEEALEDALKKDLLGDFLKDLGFFGTLLAAIGISLGTLAGKILLPVTTFLKLTKVMTPLVKGFKVLGDVFKNTKMFKIFATGISKLGVFGKWFVKQFSIFGKAFKLGFTKLAWPLQIIFSVIDFYKGFIGTEGTFMAKIQSGLKEAFLGFIELPVKLLAKLFGGEGAKWMEVMGKGFDMIFEGWGLIADGIMSIGQTVMSYVVDSGVIEMFKTAITFTWDMIKGVFNKGISLLQGIWSLTTGDLDTAIANFSGAFGGMINFIKSTFTTLSDVLTNIPSMLGSVVQDTIKWITDKFSSIPFVGEKIKNLFSDIEIPETTAPVDTATLEPPVVEIPELTNIVTPQIEETTKRQIELQKSISNYNVEQEKATVAHAKIVKTETDNLETKKIDLGSMGLFGESLPENIPVSDFIKQEKVIPVEVVSQPTTTDISTLELQKVKAKQETEATRATKVASKMDENIKEMKVAQERQIQQNNILIQTVADQKAPQTESFEPPDEIENAGMLLFNKSWGMS